MQPPQAADEEKILHATLASLLTGAVVGVPAERSVLHERAFRIYAASAAPQRAALYHLACFAKERIAELSEPMIRMQRHELTPAVLSALEVRLAPLLNALRSCATVVASPRDAPAAAAREREQHAAAALCLRLGQLWWWAQRAEKGGAPRRHFRAALALLHPLVPRQCVHSLRAATLLMLATADIASGRASATTRALRLGEAEASARLALVTTSIDRGGGDGNHGAQAATALDARAQASYVLHSARKLQLQPLPAPPRSRARKKRAPLLPLARALVTPQAATPNVAAPRAAALPRSSGVFRGAKRARAHRGERARRTNARAIKQTRHETACSRRALEPAVARERMLQSSPEYRAGVRAAAERSSG